ncbi:DUF6088 family protein [Mesorhizobium muleiense]|uniref:DUF6088 family protein n=1 Tax=Mesorhizobium muleiense TaxID=1004279 RepID=UPI000AB29184|nr:DUF6088 family protein [Mesorhizobium muleiense]MCF6102079.1 DUF6088 family protein [Mesorhizobium muleiense]
MFRFTHERARLVEIARQRRAEQARLAKLEEQRVEYLDRKLAQAEQRDRLRTFLMTLPPDSISEEASVRSITGRYGTRAPSVEQAVQAFARQQGEIVVPSGAAAANILGLSTQVPVRSVYLTSGRSRSMSFGKQVVELRHAPRWQLALADRPAGVAIRALAWLGPESADTALGTLKRTLSPHDFSELASAAPQLPTWLAQAVGKAAYGRCPSQP